MKKFIEPEIILIELEVEDIMNASFGDNEIPWEDEI